MRLIGKVLISILILSFFASIIVGCFTNKLVELTKFKEWAHYHNEVNFKQCKIKFISISSFYKIEEWL